MGVKATGAKARTGTAKAKAVAAAKPLGKTAEPTPEPETVDATVEPTPVKAPVGIGTPIIAGRLSLNPARGKGSWSVFEFRGDGKVVATLMLPNEHPLVGALGSGAQFIVG